MVTAKKVDFDLKLRNYFKEILYGKTDFYFLSVLYNLAQDLPSNYILNTFYWYLI